MNDANLKLTGLKYIRISHFEVLLQHLKKASLYQQISRWLKNGKIIQLKKGFYTTREYWERHASDPYYIYYLANVLRYPSYVSSAYVLQHYDILTDIVYPITSVTTKTPRKYSNKLGNFVYYSIMSRLYTGYEKIYYKGEPIYVATKSKSLFDYLYFKYFRSHLKPEEIIERERLNLEKFTKKDILEFSRYCKLSRNRIIIELCVILFKL